MWLNLGLSWKIREFCVFRSFLKIDLCSAISFKRSRGELSIDVAELRSIIKINETRTARFIFTPKTGNNSLKQVFLTSSVIKRLYTSLILMI